MQEQTLILGPYKTIAGVFTPASNNIESHTSTALLCLTAGMLHHVGPHRLHVLLARALAKHGISTFRFDFSGIGDSAIRPDDMPANAASIQEINEVISELEQRGFTRFILFGICSGAAQALKAAIGNSKVVGLILINVASDPSEGDANPQIAAQYYLKRSIWNPQAWKNLFTGRVKYRELITTLYYAILHKIKGRDKNALTMQDSLQRGLQPYIDQGISILMALSDRHAQFYELHRKAFDSQQDANFKTSINAETDHMFTSLSAQQSLIEEVCQWSTEVSNKNI